MSRFDIDEFLPVSTAGWDEDTTFTPGDPDAWWDDANLLDTDSLTGVTEEQDDWDEDLDEDSEEIVVDQAAISSPLVAIDMVAAPQTLAVAERNSQTHVARWPVTATKAEAIEQNLRPQTDAAVIPFPTRRWPVTITNPAPAEYLLDGPAYRPVAPVDRLPMHYGQHMTPCPPCRAARVLLMEQDPTFRPRLRLLRSDPT